MPTTRSNATAPLRHALILHDPETLSGTLRCPARRFGLDRALAGLADCGRLMRDIVIGALCGVTAGLFYAIVDASF
jgi:hypothetical protein